jgi:hypothetical protein
MFVVTFISLRGRGWFYIGIKFEFSNKISFAFALAKNPRRRVKCGALGYNVGYPEKAANRHI